MIGEAATNIGKEFKDFADTYKMVNIGEKEAPSVVVAKVLRDRRIKRYRTKRVYATEDVNEVR